MSTTTNDSPAKASANSKGAGSDGASDRGRLSAASQRAAEAYQTARERTAAAYASAGRRTSQGIESNPVAAVAGGLALGAIVAALLPRTQKEEELLGAVGRRINDSARDAARAARESGKQQLDELGLTKDGIKRRLDEFSDRAAGAVKKTTNAAADKATGSGNV
ncbi:MAG TPA: hypothetical protein VGB59_11400 [Allosphingosinicella sp.]|jgi:ElaB/YqjD/DUF883 family membrane-anchored ribosome-binding protein